MSCNLLCEYNKRSRIFKWLYIDIDINDLDNLWCQLNYYCKKSSNRKIIISGYEACCQYIKDIKALVENNKAIDNEDFACFFSFKNHIKNLLRDICYEGYIVTGPEICDEYISIFNKCANKYNSNRLDMLKLIELFEQLHIEERILIGKMYGLRVIKNAK